MNVVLFQAAFALLVATAAVFSEDSGSPRNGGTGGCSRQETSLTGCDRIAAAAIARNLLQVADPFVRGGHPASKGRFPYACSLRVTGTREHGCGGALVGKKWVLTAAHCVSGPESVGATPIAYVGAHGINDVAGAEVIPSVKVFVHEGWTGNSDDGNDIALLLLERESTKTPVRMADASQQLGTSQIVMAVGWGRISKNGPRPSTLQVADDLEYVGNTNCLNVWSQIKDNMLCAHATSQGTCHGDSGGPLVIPDEGGVPDFDLLVGLVSFGPSDCGGSQEGRFHPGVYTRVSYFRQWIDEKMGSQTSAPETSPPSEAEIPAKNADDGAEKQGVLNSELYSAAGSRDSDKVKELISKGADVASTHEKLMFTSLHLAASEGHVETVETLIKEGASVDAQSGEGTTSLYLAAFAGHLDVARVLVKAGATVDLERDTGATPLIIAAEENKIDMAKFLLESGAGVNLLRSGGVSSLHKAARAGNPDLVQLLLDNGAEVDAQDKNGETPLFWAAVYGSGKAIEVLKKSGADLSITNKDGGTIEDATCRCLTVTDPSKFGCPEGACGEGETERLKQILKD